MSNELDTELFQFDDRGFLRYPKVIIKTLYTLFTRKPETLFAQNPSTVLAFLAAFIKPILGYRLIVDRHSLSNMSKSAVIRFFDRYSLDHADTTIVTNKNLKESLLRSNSNRNICVLPDRFPSISASDKLELAGGYNVFFVCAWADDEPISNVIEAASLLSDDIVIYISGKPKISSDALPTNVRLTGYLSQLEYDALLKSVDVVLDLTTAENCLVCGAYEAVAAGKPLITSKTKILSEYFDSGVLHISHEPEVIADAIRTAIDRRSDLEKEISALKIRRETEWYELLKRYRERGDL